MSQTKANNGCWGRCPKWGAPASPTAIITVHWAPHKFEMLSWPTFPSLIHPLAPTFGNRPLQKMNLRGPTCRCFPGRTLVPWDPLAAVFICHAGSQSHCSCQCCHHLGNPRCYQQLPPLCLPNYTHFTGIFYSFMEMYFYVI